MDRCDVLIVGGGPAGSSCAWKLRDSGLDVIVLDRAVFPRDKVCAGWITPPVIDELRIDCEHYRLGRTFQPITAFRTGVIGRAAEVETAYPAPVSYGIRRSEFDHYLLQRCGARVRSGTPIAAIRQSGGTWIVNESIAAPMLVGAGGHFCPIARRLNPARSQASQVVAQEAEFRLDDGERARWTTVPETPELFFCGDLKGYGWCFRKGDYLNVGLGRLDPVSLPRATSEFVRFLQARRKIPSDWRPRWHGHAYLIAEPPRRRVADAGVLLAGDAAGLAYPESGEGIRPAIESGLLAAASILEAGGRYSRARLDTYTDRLRARFGERRTFRLFSRALPARASSAALRRLIDLPWVVRHVVLDRWFLHAHQSPLKH
jgi:geranylgeranyl reductase family protein